VAFKKIIMNIHLERYIEEQGYEPIGEDLFECPGGHVWHIDDIEIEYHEDKNPDR